jgi:hypothetical protein
VHAYNLNYSGSGSWEDLGLSPAWANKLDVVVHACNPHYAGGIGRRIIV